MASRDGSSGKRSPRPAKTAGARPGDPTERPDVASEDEFPGGDVQLAQASDIGSGAPSSREELQTDGPVMGGPGMVRTGGDRAVSTGTGGLAAGEDLDPVAEGDYWRENFRRRPYYEAEREFSEYEPAYRYGWERAGLSEYRNRSFEEVEVELRRGWESTEQEPRPSWDDARQPARDAFERAREGRREKATGTRKEVSHGSGKKS
jgi:hypothetical protein